MYNCVAAENTEMMDNLKTFKKFFLTDFFFLRSSKSPTVCPSDKGGLWRMMGEEYIKVGSVHQRAWLIAARTESRTAGAMSWCESVCQLCQRCVRKVVPHTCMRFTNNSKWEFTQ